MLSPNQSYRKDSHNHSLAHIPNVENKRMSNVQLNIPRASHIELVDKRGSSINEIEDLVDGQQILSKKALTKKQKIIIAVVVFFVISCVIGGLVAYKVISDNNEKDSTAPQIPQTYPTYKSKIQAGQENNIIQLIHVPNSQRIYNYNLKNYRTVYNADNETEVISLPSNYKFGLICLDVNEKEFNMILYFMESDIPISQNLTVKFQDYPLNDQYMQNNIPKAYQSRIDASDNNDHQNFNELSGLNEEEIQLLKSKNIDPEDFLKSNLPLVRFTVLKTGQIGEIEKPMNIRFDLQQVLFNILEQISPVVLKDYYTTSQSDSNGNKRMLKRENQKYTRRVLNNQNVPVNMEAQVSSNLSAKLDKSYEDIQITENTKHKTSYSQINSFQNGALLSSDILSTVALTSQQNPNSSEEDKQLFKTMLVDSEGQIKFISQQDIVDNVFLQQLIQDQQQMLKLRLTWEEVIELQNSVQKYENEKSASSNAGRLLQVQLDEKVVGKEIKASIFKNAYASIDFGADFYSGCMDIPAQKQVRCSSSFIGKFHQNSKKIYEQNITKSYTEGAGDKIAKQLNYVKNNVFNLMGGTRQKVSNKIDAALDLLNTLILKNTQFQSRMVQSFRDQTAADKQNLTDKMNIYNKYISNYTDYVINLTKDVALKYNQTLQTMIPEYKEVLEKSNANLTAQYDGRLSRYRALLKSVIDGKIKVMSSTKDTLLKIAQNEMDQMAKVYNQSNFPISDVTSKLQDVCKKLDLDYTPLANSMYDTYNPIWAQVIDKMVNVTHDVTLKKGFPQYLINFLRSSVVTNYACKPVKLWWQQASYFFNIFSKYKEANKAVYQNAASYDIYLANQILVDVNLKSDSIAADANSLSQELSTLIDISNIYNDFVSKVENVANQIYADSNPLQTQSMDVVQDFYTTSIQMGFNTNLNMYQAYQNFVNKLNEQPAMIQKEYEDQTSLVNENSAKILSQIESLYIDVLTFLENKNYPEVDPLNDQIPPNDSLFNDVVFGVTNEYLSSQLDKIQEKLSQLHAIVDGLSNLTPQIQAVIDDLFKFLSTYNVSIPTRPEAEFNPQFIGVLTRQFQTVANSFKVNAQSTLTNINFSSVASLPTYYAKIDSFVNTDILVTLKQEISLGQSKMAKQYNDPITTGKSFGDKSSLNIDFTPILVRSNYTYVYPTPVGISIKLNLYVNWTAGMQSALTTEQAKLKFESIANVKAEVKGVFSALIATTEIGGYADGTFIDASLRSTINVNVNDNTGSNNLEGKYGPTNIKIGQYMLIYVPKVVTDCSSKEVIFKPADNNGIKSSIISTVAAGIKSITGSLPTTNKCQTIITSSAIKSNLFLPIEALGKTYTKVLVDEKY